MASASTEEADGVASAYDAIHMCFGGSLKAQEEDKGHNRPEKLREDGVAFGRLAVEEERWMN